MMVISMTCTTTTVAHWHPLYGHKMHHAQTPDVTYTGVAVEMPLMYIRADDFRCSESGYITDIHIWGAFKEDNLPATGPSGLLFYISIWSNIPASPYPPYDFSRPGQMLWQKVYSPHSYTVKTVAKNLKEAWCFPETGAYTENDHRRLYQYNFNIPVSEAFLQKEGQIYWLGVRQYFTYSGQSFGWKSTDPSLQWNDNAVMMTATGWQPLSYPVDHPMPGQPLDFAFVIDGIPPLIITWVPPPLTPKTLNLKSNGRWVTVQLEPSEPHEAEDIVLDTVLLEDTVPVDWGKITGENVMLKVDRGELEDLILKDPPPVKPAEFKISGSLADGTQFVVYSEPVSWDPQI